MSHLPTNHSLRGLYRTLVLLISVGMIVFAIVGYLASKDHDFFARKADRVWGMSTNPAFAVLCGVAGLVLLVGLVLGRNLDVRIDMIVGTVLLVVATAMLALLRTPNNVLAFSITNVSVLYVVGMVLIAAGLYSFTDKTARRANRRPVEVEA